MYVSCMAVCVTVCYMYKHVYGMHAVYMYVHMHMYT